MIPGAIESIDGDVLSRLLSTGVLKSRALEFKRDLTGGVNDDKKEFLADVTVLANTLGGYLIYGVDETAGIVSAAVGVVVEDKDAAQLRLEQLLRHGFEPRMAGVRMHWDPERFKPARVPARCKQFGRNEACPRARAPSSKNAVSR